MTTTDTPSAPSRQPARPLRAAAHLSLIHI